MTIDDELLIVNKHNQWCVLKGNDNMNGHMHHPLT